MSMSGRVRLEKPPVAGRYKAPYRFALSDEGVTPLPAVAPVQNTAKKTEVSALVGEVAVTSTSRWC
jgi:hypothetical protein